MRYSERCSFSRRNLSYFKSTHWGVLSPSHGNTTHKWDLPFPSPSFFQPTMHKQQFCDICEGFDISRRGSRTASILQIYLQSSEQTHIAEVRRNCNPQRETDFTGFLLKVSQTRQISNLKSL